MIEIKNLTKKYKNDKGVFDINLNVKKGMCYGLIGQTVQEKLQLLDN
ncbi:hypothetical protein SGLAD_v1c04530 [Spiroplasma gladiatoris]|uniref:ABC transporter ATP-binding protein n=1 Tax=Spiroplasma gladiatoris TaxID=2143 RepID=A0A4P7AHI5_9MOLU|nr:hypothetical protein [Spiroplasma gladiatoris]QBQ07652.1 hypothetical protein SGLAD_v1c04530 [Spiroplasma gladiatoris]